MMPDIDGRTMRGWRTRHNLIRAVRLQVIAGTNHPTAGETAAICGVATHTLFHHFGTLEKLYDAALNNQATTALLRRIPGEPRAMALAFMRAA